MVLLKTKICTAVKMWKNSEAVPKEKKEFYQRRFIKYLINQFQEADLERRAIKLVLADFKASQEKTGVAKC